MSTKQKEKAANKFYRYSWPASKPFRQLELKINLSDKDEIDDDRSSDLQGAYKQVWEISSWALIDSEVTWAWSLKDAARSHNVEGHQLVTYCKSHPVEIDGISCPSCSGQITFPNRTGVEKALRGQIPICIDCAVAEYERRHWEEQSPQLVSDTDGLFMGARISRCAPIFDLGITQIRSTLPVRKGLTNEFELPLTWSPWDPDHFSVDSAYGMGIHGDLAAGKTVLLATFANQQKEEVPVLVITDGPDAYPRSGGRLQVEEFPVDDILLGYQNGSIEGSGWSAGDLIGRTLQWNVTNPLGKAGENQMPVLIFDVHASVMKKDLILRLLKLSHQAQVCVLFSNYCHRNSAADSELVNASAITVRLNQRPYQEDSLAHWGVRSWLEQERQSNWVLKAGERVLPIVLPNQKEYYYSAGQQTKESHSGNRI